MANTPFDKNNVRDILSKEWLVTNGIGGYASSSLCGANTRKYHGILVASLNPPTNRYVLVSKIEESILLDDKIFKFLSSTQFPGSVHPEGYKQLESFQRLPLPAFVFRYNEFAVEKTIFMPYNHNATVVEYKNIGNIPVKLKLNPLFVDRDYHSLFRQDGRYDYYYEASADRLKIHSHYGSRPLYWKFSKGSFKEERCWHKNVEYLQELDRGLEFKEDIYDIGALICELQPNESVYLTFSLEEKILEQSPEKIKSEEIERINKLVPQNVKNDFYKHLIISADQFLVHRSSTSCYSILAGYHWFTDWGRDTMITMLGATISLGKSKETISIMSTFLKYLDQGMVPNRFPDREHEEPEYNTVDGTLWLFVAVYEYYQKFQDEEFLKAMYPFLGEILMHHIDGTRYNIHATDEGMLWAGDASTQLTWMDVKIGDHVVTPRYGSPVEINALWYNALKIYDFITQRTNQKADIEVGEIIQKFEANFQNFFWNKDGYLNDVYYGDGKYDGSIRPNQLYAISLPFTLLDKEKQKKVCETAEKHLLTRLGMRSLSPSDKAFRPTYEGNTWSRDTAYHQGTVWPFLVGEFMMAHLKAYDYSEESKTKCKDIIDGFQDHFYNNTGIHCISEILDGLEPKEGKGCINQAWSIGALIRVLDKADLLTK